MFFVLVKSTYTLQSITQGHILARAFLKQVHSIIKPKTNYSSLSSLQYVLQMARDILLKYKQTKLLPLRRYQDKRLLNAPCFLNSLHMLVFGLMLFCYPVSA